MEEAMELSTGYDSERILGKVRDSLLKVKRGEAVYERDSVLFDKVQYSWPAGRPALDRIPKWKPHQPC